MSDDMQNQNRGSSLLALDPGTHETGWIICDTRGGRCAPIDMGIMDNDLLINEVLRDRAFDNVVIEWIQSYGMPVGASTFETCRWIGRFHERFLDLGCDVNYLTRGQVKLHLCGTKRARDINVRHALIDLYGGSRRAAVGTESWPGLLYGVRSHIWSALAVARTWADTRGVF